jgi:hypothetical protein
MNLQATRSTEYRQWFVSIKVVTTALSVSKVMLPVALTLLL